MRVYGLLRDSTHIDGNSVFNIADTTCIQYNLYQKYLKQDQWVSLEDLFFSITFTPERKLTKKKLKHVINNYHFLTPGTTKNIKLKPTPADMFDISKKSTRSYMGTKVFINLSLMFNTRGRLLCIIQYKRCIIILVMQMVIPKISITIK